MFWTGLFIAIVGLWVILRTVRKDSTDQTLVDRILGPQKKERA
jgi:hypothetical protein